MTVYIHDLRRPRLLNKIASGDIAKVEVHEIFRTRYIKILLDSGYEIEMKDSDLEKIREALKKKEAEEK